MLDQGKYSVSLEVMKRNGYGKTASSRPACMDGSPGLALRTSLTTVTWRSWASPVFAVTAGAPTLAFTRDVAGAAWTCSTTW